jgi:hypothetical protein
MGGGGGGDILPSVSKYYTVLQTTTGLTKYKITQST